ncbi:MAG: cysteine--tRNA ligase [Anaerolineales bacterium]|nr:cysteine--tRNA ligase [Anaerolineales bacterium]MCW5888405.1 cysteine--tRNA ligase [Anaerolineales bacterium]
MTLRIYNTLTRQTETFETLQPNQVSMYVCGPTVYANAHIGHAMSSLVFDIVRRYLEYRGYQVRHAMNYTDVDDKIIIRANDAGEDPLHLAERYIEQYAEHLRQLNVLPATVYPRATEEIPAIIDMVAGLIASGHAYPAEGDVYYRVDSDEEYGKLSHRKLEDMNAGARINVDERKEHPMDFALWKAAKPGEPAWDSPWGPGRPGWHIECSAMVFHHLGEQIDIHGGGNDLIFPHHENEIAQSESLSGKPFARYWMHNGMMQLSGEKMSKSLGNLITIEDFVSEHEPDVLRMMILNTSYRRPLTYSDEVVESAGRGLERLRSGLNPPLPGARGAAAEIESTLQAEAQAASEKFVAAMDDDFNSAAALAVLFDLVRVINQTRDADANEAQLAPAQAVLRELSGVLGLRLARAQREVDAAPFVELVAALQSEIAAVDPAIAAELQAAEPQPANLIAALLEARVQLRAQKQWQLSDTIRDRLATLGVIVEDSVGGSAWRWV